MKREFDYEVFKIIDNAQRIAKECGRKLELTYEEEDYPKYFEKAMQMAKDLEVPVVFSKITHPIYKGSAGVYWNETRSIQINTDVYNIAKPTSGLVHTLVHEIIHAVQHILMGYESFNYSDDLDEIKKNEIKKRQWMEDCPIFELEADRLATQVCNSWGMKNSAWNEGYSMRHRSKGDDEFKLWMWNEVYHLEIPREEVFPNEKEEKEAA